MLIETERLKIRDILRSDELPFIEMAADGSLNDIGFDRDCSSWMKDWILEAQALEQKDNPRVNYLAYAIESIETGITIGSVGCSYYDDMKKTGLGVLISILLMFVLASCGKQSQNTLVQVTETKENCYETIYDGIKHDFQLDLPATVENAPLVVMLPGYGESAGGFRQKVSFEKEANERGFAVVYVTGAPSPEDKTSSNGWNSGIGESSKKDVEFLCGLSHYLCKTYKLDETRVYAVGFSNGAFMTHRLALEANDVFSGVVSVAGMMPESIWENKPEKCAVSVFQITGEKDDVVPKNSDGSAKYSKAPAIESVIAYYVEQNGLSLSATDTMGEKSILTKYTAPGSDIQIWNLYIPDGRHSWPEERFTGFETNQLILDFLEELK